MSLIGRRLSSGKSDVVRYQYLVVKYNDLAQWLSWLERRPVTAEVTGSSPVWVVK